MKNGKQQQLIKKKTKKNAHPRAGLSKEGGCTEPQLRPPSSPPLPSSLSHLLFHGQQGPDTTQVIEAGSFEQRNCTWLFRLPTANECDSNAAQENQLDDTC